MIARISRLARKMFIGPVLVACALCMATLASAASHDITVFIKDYDLDKDGAVSKEEFAQKRERRFAATDADRSGRLSRDEYVEEYRTRFLATHAGKSFTDRQMKQTEVRFRALDTNRDGQISAAEYAHSGWTVFTRHEYSGDGVVSSKDDVEPKDTKQSATRDAERVGEAHTGA